MAKQLYEVSQLKQLGINVGRLIKTKMPDGSSITFNKPDNTEVGVEYYNIMRELDFQQCISRYVWEGLPENQTSWLIETMLYYQGSICGFFTAGELILLPYAITKGININGLPNAVTPFSFNGELTNGAKYAKGLELPVASSGFSNNQATACILYDKPPMFTSGLGVSRWVLTKNIIDIQAEIIGRIKVNIKNSNEKFIYYVDDEKQARQAQKDLECAFEGDKPFIIMRRDLANNMKADKFSSGIDLVAQALFQAWQSLNSMRCMVSGIPNAGAFEKSGRLITGEKDDSVSQNNLILKLGLSMRQLFLTQMKTVYPQHKDILDKITVKINEEVMLMEEYIGEANVPSNQGGTQNE